MEDSTVQQPKQNSSFLDKFFITATASGIFGGTISTVFFSSLNLVPIVPAIFFGLGISSLVYHFMGGIKPDTKVKIGAVTLTGTLGSLIATIYIFNALIEKQIKTVPVTLSFSPEQHSLLALQKETGEAVKVSVDLNGIPKRVGETIKAPDTSDLDRIKELCRRGKGFCKEPDLLVKFQEDTSLLPGQAKVCSNQDKFLRYPLIIKNSVTKRADLVKVTATDIFCTDPDGKPITIKISSMNAENFLEKGVIENQGTATIPPLKDLPIKDVPLTSQINIAQNSLSN